MECKNCGKSLEHKNLKAKFCSTSCRVSFYQKQKRLQEKKPLIAAKTWFQKNVSKAAIWFFLILVGLYIFPMAFSSGIRIIKEYRIEVQNEELQKVKKENQDLEFKTIRYDDLVSENQRLKTWLRSIADPENGWMEKSLAKELKERFKKENINISE